MPEFTEHKPGTPVWVDLATSDLPAAVGFYTSLFGWDAVDTGPETGHYTMMRLRGKDVAAVGPQMNPGQPVAWSTYLGTDDVDATAARVREAGGTVHAGPFDVMRAGRMAVLADPTGAFVCAWQPGEHIGAQLANEPNTLVWNELATPDPEAAIRFYQAAFGLGAKPFGEGNEYTLLTVDGREVAGLMPMGDHFPAGTPPHWTVYFGVDDCDATVARAGELGGTALVPPMDMPGVGRFAALADPQGAAFAVIRGAGQ